MAKLRVYEAVLTPEETDEAEGTSAVVWAQWRRSYARRR
jgi:hypothetical protein